MKKNLLVAACAFAIATNGDQHQVLIPEGEFRGMDGRPFEVRCWILTPDNGRAMAAALNQRSTDMVVDYEHATLETKNTGNPAPASGWLKSGGFEYVEGVGLCSNHWHWNARAQEMIAAEEYKYLSPVFLYTKTGEVMALLHVALTNTPNLDNLPEAKLAAAAQDFLNPNSEDSNMDELLEYLRMMLNLPLAATPEEIKAELAKLQARITESTGVVIASNSKSLFDAVAAIDGLKIAANSQATPDLSQYVPIAVVTDLQQQLAAANSKAQTDEVDTLIKAACSDGRLLGDAHIKWARELGKSNAASLKSYLDTAPKIAALSQSQAATAPVTTTNPASHSSVANSVFDSLGVSAADVEKYGAKA